MIVALIKPFGSDNYLVLTKPEEFTELFSKLTPGDEFICRALELSDEEFNGLGTFEGFQGPEGEGEGEPNENPEQPEETPEDTTGATSVAKETTPPAKTKLTPPPTSGASAQ